MQTAQKLNVYLWTNNQFSSELTTGQLLLHAGGVIWELMVTAIAGLMNCYSGWSKINCFQLRKTLSTKCQSVNLFISKQVLISS